MLFLVTGWILLVSADAQLLPSAPEFFQPVFCFTVAPGSRCLRSSSRQPPVFRVFFFSRSLFSAFVSLLAAWALGRLILDWTLLFCIGPSGMNVFGQRVGASMLFVRIRHCCLPKIVGEPYLS